MTEDLHLGERFEVLSDLGGGGTGIIFAAYDRDRQHRVAIKMLRDANPAHIAALKDEFRALRDITHPNLLALFDLLEHEGQWFFTMELVEGTDLISHVRREEAGDRVDAEAGTVQIETGEAARLADASSIEVFLGDVDEDRLRDALRQLSRGLLAIHRAGKVHRDVKPTNVRVSETGRVVLLDFGLVKDEAREKPGMIEGTVPYMAPEQGRGDKVGAAADWYALGVIIYEALTGRLPFEGESLSVLTRKQRETAPPIEDWAPGAPRDLIALSNQLLSRNAADRPDGVAVLRALSERIAERDDVVLSTERPPFVGRAAELVSLSEALKSARQGRFVLVDLLGADGVGKSTLVAQFTQSLPLEVAALTGVCTKHEQVPLRGIEQLVDALVALSDEQSKTGPPLHAAIDLAPLAAVFPSVSPLATSGLRGPRASTLEAAARAFGQWLAVFAKTRPVVLILDDLHDADAEGLRFLNTLAEVAPAGVLFVVARRATPLSLPDDRQVIDLGPLARPAARELAESLSRGGGLSAESILDAAQNNPRAILELSRQATDIGDSPQVVRKERAIRSRTAGLSEVERDLLELISVSSRPLSPLDARETLELEAREVRVASEHLRLAALIRLVSGSQATGFQIEDALVGRIVSMDMSGARRRDLHRRLAKVLQKRSEPPAALLAVHWRAAGDPQRASTHAFDAASISERSGEHIAAARHYAAAASDLGGERRQEALEGVARTLAAAGHRPEAAAAFKRAASSAEGVAAYDLTRRSAGQWLLAGRPRRAIRLLEPILTELGENVAATAVKPQLFAARVKAWARGYGYDAASAPLSPKDEIRLDTLWSLSNAYAFVDVTRSAYYQTLHLGRALGLGHVTHIARALSAESLYVTSTSRRRARSVDLLARARSLAEASGDREVMGYHETTAALVYLQRGRWTQSLSALRRAENIFRELERSFAFEVTAVRAVRHWLYYLRGDLRELHVELSKHHTDAVERGDASAALALGAGLPSVAWLIEDAPWRAREMAAQHTPDEDTPGQGIRDVAIAIGLACVALYEGDGPGALSVLRAEAKEDQSIRSSPFLASLLSDLRGRAALATLREAPARRFALLAKEIAQLERRNEPWTSGLAALLRAGVAAKRERPQEKVEALLEALRLFSLSDMQLHRAATEWRLAEARGDDLAMSRAERWFRKQEVASPERLVGMLAPF